MKTLRTSVAALVAALPLLLVACEGSVEVGGRILEGDDLEAEITDSLEEEVGQRPASIDCPDEVDVEEGGTFECALTADDGSTATVVVTMTDDEGSYEYEVTE